MQGVGRNGTAAFLGIRPGEGWPAFLFFAYFLVLATAHYAAKSVRQATYIDSIGADKLPWVYLAVALVSFPVLLVYTRFSERHRPYRMIIVSSMVQAASWVIFYVLFSLDQAWVAIAFYVWTTVAFGVAVSQYWSYAHRSFDARQARRLFAFIGAGGLLGGVPGGLLARGVAAHYGTRYILLAAALLMLGVMVLAVTIHRRSDRGGDICREASRIRDLEGARGGLRTVFGSRLLLYIAGLMVLMVVVAQMVDLQFYWAVERHTTGLDQRASVVGAFFSVMGILAFVFQIVFTRRIHHRLGVEVGMRVLPLSVAITSLLFVLAMGLLPGLVFALAWVLKIGETGFRHSIDQASRELLFQPVSEQMRTRAKAFIDVFVQRFAKGVAAVLLLPVTFGLVSMQQLGWMTMVLAVIWLGLTLVVQREYVRAFREGLVSGVLQEPAAIDSGDLTTITTLVQSLGSSEPRQVLHGLELLAANGYGNLVPPLLLHHADAEVRRKTLEVLAAAGREDATSLVERAVGDADPDVRSGAMQTLSVLQGERASGVMIPRLADADPRVRATAVANLLGGSQTDAAAQAQGVLQEMVADTNPELRTEVARALATVKEPTACATLVQLLYDDEVLVVRETINTVRERVERDGQNPIYSPILISLMGNRRLKHQAREALVACGESAIATSALFMRSPDEQIWVRRAVPKTIALAGTQQAADALVASLGEGDCMLRVKTVDALVYMRSRNPGLSFPVRAIQRQIRLERDRYLLRLAELWALTADSPPELVGPMVTLQSGEGRPTLLEQLLALRLGSSVDCLFGLLGLIYPLGDVRAAHRSLLSGSAQMRARALEYLDNSLRGGLKRDVFAVIDDAAVEGKLEHARRVLGGSSLDRSTALSRLMTADTTHDPAAVSLTIAAVHTVLVDGVRSLYPQVRALATDSEHPWVEETARWVMEQIGGADADGGNGAGGGRIMAVMAHIEMVVFLQRVDLFSFCNAEQVVQLAAIASERRCTDGEVIFRRKDPPDALYCVVEGSVCLSEPGREDTVIRADGRFGVVDILSGRRRSFDAAAAEDDTRLLTIPADDLFDLLSNNIEIVKALFRQVL